MVELVLRSIKPALIYSSPLILILIMLGWTNWILIVLVFAPFLVYHWLFMEVDFDKIRSYDTGKISACVVGSGISGICMGVKLKKAGIPFVMLEMADNVGGTWYKNRYPGCAVDIPSELYQFSFHLNCNWTKKYADREEILRYLESVASHFDLGQFIRFNTKVLKAEWNDQIRKWKLDIQTSTGKETMEVTHLMSGCGYLSSPNIPEFPGKHKFKGRHFHSKEWDESYDYNGKKVGIIGSAASAVQIAPAIVDKVKTVDVYQRTPNWHIPRNQETYDKKYSWPHPFNGWMAKLNRFLVYFNNENESLNYYFEDDPYAETIQRSATQTITDQLADNEDLKAKVVPDFALGCKRFIRVDDFFPIFVEKSNACLITEPIAEITEKGIKTTDGQEHEYDLIVYATGFNVVSSYCGFETIGRNGVNLKDHLQNGSGVAYYGASVDNFPNFFLLLGPNTNLSNNSVVVMVESVTNQVLQLLSDALARNVEVFEVKKKVLDNFEDYIDQINTESTQNSKTCQSYYKNSRGQNRSVWTKNSLSFWLESRRVVLLRDFEITKYKSRY